MDMDTGFPKKDASGDYLVEKTGGITATMIDIINSSTGRNNATQVKFHQQIFNNAFASGFHLDLMTKDLNAAAGMAEDLGLSAPGLTREAELWADASAATDRDADHTEIFKYLEELIGATPHDEEET